MNETRKPYAPPSLQSYGNIRILTRASFPAGMGDGAMAGSAKT